MWVKEQADREEILEVTNRASQGIMKENVEQLEKENQRTTSLMMKNEAYPASVAN